MSALIPLNADLPAIGSLTETEIADTMAYASNEKSFATRKAYRSDWQEFVAWCIPRDATALPAHPGMVAAYLSCLASSGLRASSIGRKCAAIAYRHKQHGCDPLPTSSEAVKTVMRGIRRTIGTAPSRKAPATAELISEMLKHCPETLAGKRDRALLALGFAGAFRRSELVALDVADLAQVPDGLRVTIRRSKTDQEGAGQEIAIPRGYRLRPVEAIDTWLAAAEINSGPVFRPVLKGSRLQPEPLADRAVAKIVKRYAALAGLDPAHFAGHSLRAGFITSAAESGAAVLRIADQSRHKSLDTLRLYVRRADMFRDHSGSSFL